MHQFLWERASGQHSSPLMNCSIFIAKCPGGQDTTPSEPETDIGEHQPSGVIKVEDEQQILKLFKSGSETSPFVSSRKNNALLNNKVNMRPGSVMLMTSLTFLTPMCSQFGVKLADFPCLSFSRCSPAMVTSTRGMGEGRGPLSPWREDRAQRLFLFLHNYESSTWKEWTVSYPLWARETKSVLVTARVII